MQDFPEAYFRIVETIAETGEPLSTEMKLKEARASRRDLYRFFGTIRDESASGDMYAKELFSTSQNINLTLDPSIGDPDDDIIFTVKLNPLTKFFDKDDARGAKPKSKKRSKKKVLDTLPQEEILDLTGIDEMVEELEANKKDGQE